MAKILIRKKLSERKTEAAITQTLDIAANHQLECLRRARRSEELGPANKAIERLKALMLLFVQVLAKLPPASKGKINKIMIAQDWQNFDSEAFANLINALIITLTTVSPERIANEARLILIDGPKPSNHPAVRGIVRTSAPAILDLWETIPAQMRTKAEASIRSLPSCKSAVKFFRHVATVLTNLQLKMGRRPPIEQQFARQIAKIWGELGLRVGRAYHGGDRARWAHHYPSPFQRFCDLALRAVGDSARISGRQVTKLRGKA
jgi:hypothetical protein